MQCKIKRSNSTHKLRQNNNHEKQKNKNKKR